MKIKLISVGRVKQDFVLAGEDEYLARMRSFAEIQRIEVQAATELPELQMKEQETQAVLKKVSDADFLVVLDETGKTLTSPQFASFLQTRMNHGDSSFCFAIGGAYGWSNTMRQEADYVLSLSAMTFTYQMSRLILVEQLYRAMTILKGVSYHK